MIEFKSETWLDTRGLEEALAEAVIEPLRKCALMVERRAKSSMKRGGKLRKVRGTGYLKRGAPSRPGTPPHRQSGTLVANITHAQIQGRRGRVHYIVGPASPPAGYGAVHEFGGRFHPPRPFMRPALAGARNAFPQFFANLPLRRTRAGQQMERRVEAWERRWGRRM